MLSQKEVLTLSISQPLVRRVSRAWVEPVDTVRKPCSQPEPDPQLKKWVGGLRDPDSSPFTLVWTRISWLSSLVHDGKAATIC
jgi:hypothetical protein